MDVNELDKLIRIGEGHTIEFKSSPSHIGREICAFANAVGGYILVGVDDDGIKTGVKNLNRTKSELQSTARSMDPPLALEIEAVDNVLVVTVPSGPNKPYSANGIFFIREASNSQRMKREEIRQFFFREGLIRFDEQPCNLFDMRWDFDNKKYQAFKRAAQISQNLKREDLLKNLHVITNDGITNAGALLFSKQVPKFFLQASLTCAMLQGTTKTKILDQATFEGNIPENYQEAMSYLLSHLNTEYTIRDGPREEILELPEEALREAILNALAHRDYRSTSNIQIHLFRDRLEIVNPGGLVSGLKMKDLGRVSRPRNLLLFSLMARMDLVEQIGSGIKRIREAVHSYGLPPPIIEADTDWFSITFRRKAPHEAIRKAMPMPHPDTPSGERKDEGVNEEVNEGVNTLLEFVRENPGLRTPHIASAMSMPIKTLERWLKKLRDEGKIEFRGSPKTGGYWEI